MYSGVFLILGSHICSSCFLCAYPFLYLSVSLPNGLPSGSLLGFFLGLACPPTGCTSVSFFHFFSGCIISTFLVHLLFAGTFIYHPDSHGCLSLLGYIYMLQVLAVTPLSVVSQVLTVAWLGDVHPLVDLRKTDDSPPTMQKSSLLSTSSPHGWFLAFPVTAIPTGVKWHLTVVLISIFLVTSDVEHLFLYLVASGPSSLENFQFLCPFFKMGLCVLLLLSCKELFVDFG